MRGMVLLGIVSFLSVGAGQECKVREGYASWYGGKFHGRKTSSGEPFNKHKYTAASRDYPIGTYLLVRNLENQKEVIVLVNDRGPKKKSRVLDLSMSAAERLGFLKKGVARVQLIPLFCLSEEEIGEDQQEKVIKDLLNTL